MTDRDVLSARQRELLQRVLSRKGIRAPTASEAIPARPETDRSRLSFAQRRLWVLDRLQPGLSAYNIPAAFRIEGPLDRAALERSFEGVLERHRVLRARFAEEDGQPVQRYRQPGEIRVTHVDLETLRAEEREATVRRLVEEEAGRAFTLEGDPESEDDGEGLVRAKLLRLAPESHVFVVTMHHIVSDGWSVGIFIRELAALYRAHAEGREPDLPALPIQYADFAEWQRGDDRREILREQLEHWRGRLEDPPPPLDLPTDGRRGPRQTFTGATERFTVEPETAEALAALGRRHGATLFMVLLAAFEVLLHRYTGAVDLTVGTPVAGRERSELEPLIGFFANTLVLRGRIDPAAGFEELLERVKADALDAFAHQDVPFERLVEALQPRRRMDRTPLFQVMFALENVPRSQIGVSDLVLERVNVHNGTAKFDLTLFMREADDSLLGSFEYNSDLFDAATVRRLADHFGNLLRSVAGSPSAPVGRLDLFTPAEWERMLDEWQGPTAPPAATTVREAFRQRAEMEPDALALRGAGGTLTFGELAARAGRLAARLRAAGVGPERRVAVFLDRSPEMVIALWAVVEAGGAWVPLDPSAPAARTAFQAEDADVTAVVTRSELADRLPETAVPVIAIDDGEPEAPDGPEGAGADAAIDPDHLAYVLYTSGSTGTPKGVEVSYRALAGYLFEWCIPAYEVTEGRGAPVHSSLGFDLTITGLLAPLACGRPVTLVPERAELEELAEVLRSGSGFSLVKLTPAHLEILNGLLAEPGAAGSARALVLGGEALAARTAAQWLLRDPDGRIFNEYGPTEAVVGCCVHEVTGEDLGAAGSVPIGRPATNRRLYVLDRGLEPVPPGVAGELCIGGTALARGYAGRPGLTAERFVPDPFAGREGARMYRSGDRARHRPDGVLRFDGRLDQQLKLRGHRIEPGEIEETLRRHEGVEDAVVLKVPAPGKGEQLAAWWVPASDPAPDPVPESAELRAALRAWLPEYMVPSAFTALDAFPLTGNGKVDRDALVATRPAAAASSRRHVAPSTLGEEILASLWAEVLEVDRVGVEDDFFELGGHSMTALELVFRVREALGAELPLHAVFEAPTVAGMARRVDAEGPEGEIRLERVDRDRPLPLSFAQQRLWFLYRLAPDDPSYNISFPLRLRGRLRVDVLARALRSIAERHEVLRTSYPTVDGEPRQHIHRDFELPLSVIELRRADDPRVAVRRAMGRPFDLATGPLFRVGLFRIGDEEHVCVLVMHHIVTDAWSTDLFVGELVTLYTAFAEGRSSPFGELPFQYADFAAWQRRRLTPEAVSGLVEHWRERLGPAPPVLQLPGDRPRRIRSRVRGARRRRSLARATRDGVHRVSREHGVTPFMTTLAAFQVLLHRYSGQDDFVVGTPVAERGDRGMEGVIGLFLNMLPLRADLGGDPRLAEVLGRVREVSRDAFAHQELPFERLVEAYQTERNLAQTPLFQVLFTYQRASAPAFELPGVEVRSLDVASGTARFDITLFVIDTGDGLELEAEYAADLFDGATLDRMLRHLEGVLEALVDDAGRPVAEIPLLRAEESHQLVREWNATDRAFPLDETLHGLIHRRMEEDPSAVAVELGSGRLTYGELWGRAEALAHRLRARGVGPEVPVALCVARSPEMMVGVLGILAAGGAYLPLDPAYPIERIAYMVRDSGARMVLTQERLVDRLPEGGGVEVLCLDGPLEDGADDGAAGAEAGPLEDLSSPDDMAYVIYTSGSTGKPKGTMVSHRSVVNHGLSISEIYGLDRESRTSQFFSLSFDGSVEDLFPPFLAGAAMLLHPDPTRHALREVLDFYEERGLTVMHLPTAFWHHFAGELREGRVEIPSSLRRTTAGGEALAMDKLRDYLEDTGGDVPFVNVYGPTEATVTASALEVRRGEWDDYTGQTLPIGRPLPNVTLYLVDRALRPVPRGVVGELLIGGVGVARGYLGRPALTAERFIPDPFAGDGSRVYRTGDLGRHLRDGVLEYKGRIDAQVKIRSFRVELAEIEATLAEHPRVAEVVVHVQPHGDRADDQRLVAYVVADGEDLGSAPDLAEVRAHLERFLPAYMIPSAVVPLERIPLTPNGKIDKDALPAPRYEYQASEAYVAPRTPEEETIAGIWRDVLRVDRIGVESNFFELGGHSLLAVQVHERLRTEYRREIPLVRLFEHTTVAALARFVATEGGAETEEREREALEESDEWGARRRRALRRQRAARRATEELERG